MRPVSILRQRRPRARRLGAEAAQTLAVASQIALLCPSGLDAWMRHELGAGVELPRTGPTPRRR